MKMLKCAGLIAMLGLASSASAVTYTLTDGNSTAQVDADSTAGMWNWTVDGVNQLARQWFWYRVGNTGGERGINTLTTVSRTQPDAASLNMTWRNGSFEITIKYSLLGGSAGSGFSDISEQISIKNTGSSMLNFHFFQYSDFDLNRTPNDDTAYFDTDRSVVQLNTTDGLQLSETSVSRTPDHRQIAINPALFNSLNDTSPTTLTDTPTGGATVGPTNVSWAFQWDFNIAAGSTVGFSKDKTLTHTAVPDSGATVALLGAALTGLALLGRRFRRRQ
ncbi:MAG: VPDSG-CTERM sorting domain-containing protein [Verrucomicrobia bacterium]|nr:VPDSG-CTERM sorting domain-containing protein [Verrucomicrobiota bacterium]